MKNNNIKHSPNSRMNTMANVVRPKREKLESGYVQFKLGALIHEARL